MARAAGRKPARPSTQPAPAPDKPAPGPSSAQSKYVPEHFRKVPNSLQPFVAKLPTDHVYALHVDRTAPALKKRVYTVPILLNLAISAILAWRVYHAAPVYLDQIITIFGYDTPYKVKPSNMEMGDIVSVVVERTFLLMFDYTIFALLGSWPWEFLFGSKYTRRTGAAAWRWDLGFRPVEVVVRMGRKWDRPLLREVDENRVLRDRSRWTLDEELSIKFKIEAALRRSYTSKTGYLLLDKDWDLDYRAMIDVNAMVDRGIIKLDDVDHIVLLCWQKQWMIWHVTDAAAETKAVAAVAEEDAELRKFRDYLTQLGAEDVFFRWIEIIQYESSQPGGLSDKKRGEALHELSQLLRKRKVDYPTLLQAIGGENNIPGLR